VYNAFKNLALYSFGDGATQLRPVSATRHRALACLVIALKRYHTADYYIFYYLTRPPALW